MTAVLPSAARYAGLTWALPKLACAATSRRGALLSDHAPLIIDYDMVL
jgi:hypothetical protein